MKNSKNVLHNSKVIIRWLFWLKIKRITECIIITHGYRISIIRGSLEILGRGRGRCKSGEASFKFRTTAFHEWRTQGGHPVPFSKRAKRLARFRENV